MTGRRILALLLFALAVTVHSVWWFSSASALKTAVNANLEHVNAQLTAAHSGDSISLSAMTTTAWPLPPRLRLSDLALTQTDGSLTTRFTAPEAGIRASRQGVYTLSFQSGFTAIESRNGTEARSLRFEADPLPVLALRTSEAAHNEPDMARRLGIANHFSGVIDPASANLIAEYDATLGRKLRLTVHDGSKSAAADFDVPLPPIELWRTIPASLRQPADVFFSLLEEIADRAK